MKQTKITCDLCGRNLPHMEGYELMADPLHSVCLRPPICGRWRLESGAKKDLCEECLRLVDQF